MHVPAPGDLQRALQGFRGTRVWVVGDLMLDEYLDGEVRRISPEAPVPVVRVTGRYERLGGAANVAHCLAVLGADVQLCGAVGQDRAGDALIAACQQAGIDTAAVGQDPTWATVRKLRVVAQRQQVVRLDWEDLTPETLPDALPLIAQLQAGARPDAIVLSDYAKGFLSPAASRRLIALGTELGVPVLVDPKVDDLGVFRGATVVTPNLKEFEAVVGRALSEPDSDAFAELVDRERERAGLGALVVTLGDAGVLVSSAGAEAVALQADKREVYDVTGAGDTLIAVLALALGGGADLVTAASIANAAAGVAVRQFGTATVTLDQLARELSRRPLGTTLSPSELHEQVAMWRLQGTRVVFTNGCFDVLHAGHLALLRRAASLGDVLVVGLNDDASVTRLKGEGRPLTPQDERCALVAALDCVDAVTLFSDDTPLRLIEQVLPAVLVKGADYVLADVVGRDVVEAAGGQVVLAALVDQRSTSRLIDKARGKS